MASIMRGYRKNKALKLIISILLFSIGQVSIAADRFVKIEQASLTIQQQTATLTAELDFNLSATATEALRSGIDLYWDVSIALKQRQWPGWWYSCLSKESHRYRLSYYTLLNNYRLHDEKAHIFVRFSTLKEALVYMQNIAYSGLAMPNYDTQQCILGLLNIRFDKEMLPAPLRPIAYFDQQWDLSAKEKQWCD